MSRMNYYFDLTPQYSWNTARVGAKHHPIIQSIFWSYVFLEGNRSSPSNIAQDDGLMQDGAQYITDCCMNMGGGASNVFDIFREKLCNSRKSANQSAKLSEAMSAGTSRNRPGTRRLSLGGTEQHIKSLSTGMHICHIEVQRSFQCRSSDDISTHQCSAQCNCSNPIGLTEMKRISTSIDLSKSDRKVILMLFVSNTKVLLPHA